VFGVLIVTLIEETALEKRDVECLERPTHTRDRTDGGDHEALGKKSCRRGYWLR
jgi:hypothetical protein